MTTIAPRAAIVMAAVAVVSVACGKVGPVQAPLRPVPGAVANLTAEREADRITLKFTIPAANHDGSTPSRIDGVEIYALTQPAAAPPPTGPQLAVPAYRVARLDVRRPDPKTTPAPGDVRPTAGDPGRFEEKTAVGGDLVRYYAAAGVAGNRHGAPSQILALPLNTAPDPPTSLAIDYTEQQLRLTWTAAAGQSRFLVDEVDATGAKGKRLTQEPIAATEFVTPFEFGRERCFSVRAVVAGTGVLSIGLPSTSQCVTPSDHFPPAAPSDLQSFGSEGAIELRWSASLSADVAGYLVLRAEGADGTLRPLTPAPIVATDYRDASVKAGVTYAYQVVAVDKATPPNKSEPSNKQVVTAR